MCVASLSIQGTPVDMEVVNKRHSDHNKKDKTLCSGVWRTDLYPPTDISQREKLEWVLVMQVCTLCAAPRAPPPPPRTLTGAADACGAPERELCAQVDGTRGPESDERHLLHTKMLCKFYAADYAKFVDKGHPLGAIKLRAAIREASKVLSVTFADVEHTARLENDTDGECDEEDLVTLRSFHVSS